MMKHSKIFPKNPKTAKFPKILLKIPKNPQKFCSKPPKKIF